MNCPVCGTANEPSSNYCSNCGRSLTSPTTSERSADPGQRARSRQVRRTGPRALLGLGVAAVLAGGAYAAYQATRPETHTIMVAISDLPSGSTDCTASSYSAKYIVGTNVTLRVANGDIAGVGTMTGDGTGGANSCTWVVFMPEIPESAAYSVEISGPAGNETVRYSQAELESQNWNIDLSRNF